MGKPLSGSMKVSGHGHSALFGCRCCLRSSLSRAAGLIWIPVVLAAVLKPANSINNFRAVAPGRWEPGAQSVSVHVGKGSGECDMRGQIPALVLLV